MYEFKKLVYAYLREIYGIDKAPNEESGIVRTMKSITMMGILMAIIYAYTHNTVDGALGTVLNIAYWFSVVVMLFGGVVAFFADTVQPVNKHKIPASVMRTVLLEPQAALNSKVYTVIPGLMSIITTFYEAKWMLENGQFYVPLLWVFTTLAMLVARYKAVKAHKIIEHTIHMAAQKGKEALPNITPYEMDALAKGIATLTYKQVNGVLLEEAERDDEGRKE